MYDLVIRGGDVIDGSGLPRFRADVGVANGRIAAVGRVSERGLEEIDAYGHVVTPGFIDIHTHMDAQVFWDPLGTCSCWHGVTTVVMGNCGFTLAPATPAQRHLVMRNLEKAEDISGASMEEAIDWRWSSFRQYLDVVDSLPKGINYVANIGHSALRTYVMGERAFEESASDDDLRAMAAELRDALRAGAVGLTTSRSSAHATSDGRPVASRLANWDEVRYLVSVMGESERGIFELALEPAARSGDPGRCAEFLDRLGTLAVETRVPVTFGIHPGVGSGEALDLLDETAARGGRMFGQSHSRGVSIVLSFMTLLPFDGLPQWRSLRALPIERQREALRDPGLRLRLVEAARRGPYSQTKGPEGRKPDYEAMTVFLSATLPNPSIAALAVERGADPVDVMIDMALETDMRQMFIQPVFAADREAILKVMRHPRAVMSFSDSGAHVSQIMDSSIQTHLLSYWVRDQGAFSLEEAVQMLTLAPATAWGFSDRGLLRKGCVADLNIFDPKSVAPQMPVLVADLPAGAMRLKQESVGFLATLVAGKVVLREGRHTGALPGRLLRMST